MSDNDEGKPFSSTMLRNETNLWMGSPKKRETSMESFEKTGRDLIRIYPSNMIPKINPHAHILHMLEESNSRSRMSSEEEVPGPIRIITDQSASPQSRNLS